MRITLSIIGFCLTQLGFSQAWRNVSQADLNIKYKLPNSWEVDGFGAGYGYWDEGGSSGCDCAGTIYYGYNRALGMVIYPYSITPHTQNSSSGAYNNYQ